MPTRLLITIFAFGVSLALNSPFATAQSYVMTDLGTLGGDRHSEPRAINDAGQVVGFSTNDLTFGPDRAFFWNAGVMTELSTLGGDESSASGIDASGNIVGSSSTNVTLNAPSHAFFLGAAPMEDLGTLGGLVSWATELGSLGEVVGGSRLAGDSFHPCRWEPEGSITDLGVLSGHCCGTARAVNSAGSVVGYSSSEFALSRPVVWRSGLISDLGTLSNGCCAEAFDINDAEQIVGFSWIEGRASRHACIWNGRSKTDLGTLPGGLHSEAYAINSVGAIAGMSWSSQVPPGDARACVWRDGRICDLNTMVQDAGSWTLVKATDINNLGQIVVVAVESETRDHHAMLLTPTVRRPGDYDADGDVGLADFAFLLAVMVGPTADATPVPDNACRDFFDSDGDGDLDLRDFATFQQIYGLP